MKLRALIIDDEPLAHDIIMEYAKEVPYLEIVGQCYLATKALVFLSKQEVDLIFLDINMPKIKGLDFLRTLNQKPIVIITSAYEEYALESFELDVCDYLLKPFRFDRFLKSANKALELYRLQHPNTSLSNSQDRGSEEPNQLFIKSEKRLIQLDLSEVYFLESYGNYVKVWLKNEYHLTASTLTSFVDQLPTSDFFRIHKSYIINRKFIDYVEGNMLVMKNQKQLPIGKNNRQAFKQFLGQQ